MPAWEKLRATLNRGPPQDAMLLIRKMGAGAGLESTPYELGGLGKVILFSMGS